ncbi:unnamed protein product [Cercopithifilaria johnstoni]|uniref:Uncharacterized protein n=1 Tax=Cercopithifilaria johnstoni TaxID=2874296 RepID=A0A8J2M5V8_9BILA|nr:unnamed protein product [Cercopithifilaria johnstoni]
MDEAAAMEHLHYEKDELQTIDDVIQEDNLETVSNTTAATIDPFDQQDFSIDLQMESMRLSATDYPLKPERRTSLNRCNENATEIFAEDIIPELEQNCYDQNGLSEKESIPKEYSPVQELLLSNHHQVEETHNIQEELQDNIETGNHELPGM